MYRHILVAVLLTLKTSLLLLFLCLNKDVHADDSVDYHQRLLQDIFSNNRINPSIRPVSNFKDTISVNLFLAFLHIHYLDEFTGSLHTNGWAEITWSDSQLVWNPESFNGLHFVQVPDTLIWKPDLTILNSNDASRVFEYGKIMLYVRSDGVVNWSPPFRTATSCPIDHRYFPYDEHFCKVQMGSWTYPSGELSLNIAYDKHPEEAMIQKFSIENPQWEIIERTSEIINVSLECCVDVYPHVEYTLRLRRRSPLYKFIFVAPSVMSMMLTLATFWLPINAGEKLTLGGIAVIMEMGLLIVLSLTIPNGGAHVPHIVLFCGNSLVMTSFSLVISVMVLRFSRSHSYTPLPSIIKTFLLGPFSWILCLGSSVGTQVETNSLTKKDPESPEENQDEAIPSYSEKPSCFDDWTLLATAIDRICFVTYCVIFLIIVVGSFAS